MNVTLVLWILAAFLVGFLSGGAYVRRRDRKKGRNRVVEKPNSHYASEGVRDQEARERWESIPLESIHELNRNEVEKLLAKIRALGVKSLKKEERDFLDRIAGAS